MTKIHVKQQAGMKGKIVALATIGAVVALSIVAASLWVPQGPITFDEERYRLGESIFIKVRDLQTNDKGSIMVYKCAVQFKTIRWIIRDRFQFLL